MTARMSNDAIRAALAVIPADDRDLWLRIGMALKSELGDEGYPLFEAWSEGSSSFDVKAVKASWKSFALAGAVTMATLVSEAKQRGFDPKKFEPAAPLSKVEMNRIKQERAEREAAAAADTAAKHARAAAEAVQLWESAAPTGASAYLKRKGVAGHGLRYDPRRVLIPLWDQSGAMWNVQCVYGNGVKRFLKDARVSGCFHVIGDVPEPALLLIAEGYATAATLHEATGHAVAVAFNEANLRHVALAMRALHPTAKIMICADDDMATEAKTGKNPGVVAATAAAKAVDGAWCKPEGLPSDKTDFNDLAAVHGIAAVRAQLAAALAPAATAVGRDDVDEVAPSKAAAIQVDAPSTKAQGAKSTKPGAAISNTRRADDQSRRAFFTVDQDGVWYHSFDQRGEAMAAQWICSELRVTAQSRDSADGEWGRLLEFSDPDGNAKRWVVPSTMFGGDGTQYRSILLGMGLRIGAGLAAKNQLSVYIQTEKTEARVRCTNKIGWHDGVYVMPDRTIGTRAGGEIVVFQSGSGRASQFKQRGTLEEWKREVAANCRGNSRLLFCVSMAFASTLLPIARVPSGGFHLWGDSSSGKSTAVKAAGSVFGGRDYPRNWRLTDNSLESIATRYSDALLILDEIAQVDPKVVGDSVYMLANESGKGRLAQDASAKELATWRSMFLSDGEIDLATHMAAAGKGKKAGHDVRMAHVPADAGQGLGIYETVHGFPSGAALSDHLVTAANNLHGTAGIAFIEYAVTNFAEWSVDLPASVTEVAGDLCPSDAHGQVSRVATRFALVGLAGELATGAGITGWAPGEASTAARTCFAAWLNGRGGAGNVEHTAILRQVSGFFQLHGGSRFVSWHRATDDHAPNVINRAGFRRMLTGDGKAINSHAEHHATFGDRVHPIDAEAAEYEYFMFAEVFRNEVCKGFDPKLVTRLLIERGLLETEAGKTGATRQERLPGLGKTRVYRFKPGIVAIEV